MTTVYYVRHTGPNYENDRCVNIEKYKKGKVKSFRIDLESLAQVCRDEKLKTMELLGWGFNEKSFREI